MRAPAVRSGFLARIAAVALFAVLWFSGLGARDLLHPDEGRYAEIPREMLATGDWVTPRLDGFKYFEKPPLQYWATAATYELFGAGNATARLWTAITGFLVVLWVAYVGKRVFGGQVGDLAALFLGSSLLWIAMGHVLTLDMGFSAFLAVSIGSFLIAQSSRADPKACRRWMLLAWIAIAGAILSKGPVALVLAGGTLAIYAVWQRDREIVRRLHLLPGLGVMLLLAAPWFAIVGARNPGFAEFFFVHEHLARYTSEIAGRVHPWWMFLPVVVVGAVPWAVTAIAALVRPGFGPRAGPSTFDPVRFLWVWCTFTVAFFSCSQSKLIPYVLPIFPALALLAGRRVAEARLVRRDALVTASIGIAIVAVALTPGLLVLRNVSPAEIRACVPFVVGASGCLIAGGIAAALLRGGTLVPATILSASALLGSWFLVLGYGRLPQACPSRQIAAAIRDAVPADSPVFCVSQYDQPLPFYLGRTVDLVRVRGELAYGIAEEPFRQIPEVESFVEIWRELAQGAALLPRDLCSTLEGKGVPMRRICEGPRFVAVARR